MYYRAKYPKGEHFLTILNHWEGTLLEFIPTDLYPQIGFYSPRAACLKPSYRYLDKLGSRTTRLKGQPWRRDIPRLISPSAVAVEPASGHFFVADSQHRILVYDKNGVYLRTFGSSGNGDGQFFQIAGLCFSFDGMLVVVESANCRVQVVDPQGQFIMKFGTQGSGQQELLYPRAVTLDRLGNFVVADSANDRIQIFDPEGDWVQEFGPITGSARGIPGPVGIGIDLDNGNMIVCDTLKSKIHILSESGELTRKFGKKGDGKGKLRHPWGVAVDRYGRIVVADQQNNRIVMFDAKGKSMKFMKFGKEGKKRAQFDFPQNPAFDQFGNIIVPDPGNNRVQIFGLPEVTKQTLEAKAKRWTVKKAWQNRKKKNEPEVPQDEHNQEPGPELVSETKEETQASRTAEASESASTKEVVETVVAAVDPNQVKELAPLGANDIWLPW